MPLVAAVRPRPCLDSMLAAHHGTRASAIPQTRRRSRRSSPFCAPLATASTVGGSAASSSSSGARVCASTKRSRSAKRTSTAAAARCSFDTARAADAARWAWTNGRRNSSNRWLEVRLTLPVGPLFCVVNCPTRGRHWSSAAARAALRRTAADAGVRRRFAPHQLRHAHAVEMAHEGVPLIVIQRQLGHSNLGITSIYLQGIDSTEIIDTVHARRAPMVPVGSSLAQ